MGRRIVTEQLQSRDGEKLDTYSDKLLKNIPAEIVAAWLAISNLLKDQTDISPIILWIVFIIFIPVTGLWIKRLTDKEGKKTAKTQIGIAIGSFCVWVFAIGAPFSTLNFYKPVYGSVLLILYTLIVPIINSKE